MIWCVEDDASIRDIEVYALKSTGFEARGFEDGTSFWAALQKEKPELVVLDVMLPGVDGAELLRRIRKTPELRELPVIMATAKDSEMDKIQGLDGGADYYLTKPFDAKELLAAIRAITRPSVGAGARLTLGNLTLDRTTYELSAPGGSFRLTGKEFQVMELLMSDPSRVHRQERIFGRVWGLDSDSEINVVWVYMSYLRKKLAALGANVTIRLNRGVGYVIEVDDRNDKKD